jgi:hypothetical protein
MRTASLLFAFALVCLTARPIFAQTCTTEWAAPTSGTWSDDDNWTDGAPDASDTACITAPGTYVVTLDRRQALAGLVVGGTSGLQTLIVDGTLDPLGSGTIGPNGRVELTSSENCGSCDGLPEVTGTLTVEGTLVHETQVGLVSQGGTLDVTPGGLLLVDTGAGSVRIGGRSANVLSTVRIRGLAELSAGDNPPQSTSILGVVEIDGGTFAVPEGRVDLAADGALRNAAFEIGEAANVTLTNANSNGAQGVFEAAGTLSGVVEGSLRLSGARLRIGTDDAVLAFDGSGLLIQNGIGLDAAEGATGDFVNTGLLAFSFNVPGVRGVVLRNEGTLRVDQATLQLSEGATLDNAATGVIDLVDGGSVGGGSDGGLLTAAGQVVASLDTRPSAQSSITVPSDLDGATVEVDAAVRLQFSEGSLRDITFIVPETGEVLLTSANSNGLSGDFAAEGTLSGNVQGTVRITGARFLARPADATLAFAGNGLNIAGYGLGSSGGDFVNTGLVTFVNNSPEVRDVALRNEGELRIDNTTLRLTGGATITNAVGATVETINGGGFSDPDDAGGTLVNEGLVLKTGGGTTDFRNTLRGQPGSELRVLEGQFMFANEDPANYGAGVLLSGTGNVFLSQLMRGTVSPGTPEAPVDTLGFSNVFRLDDSQGDARLVIDLGPDGASDHIATNNTVVLGGTLVVRVLDGYVPVFGDAFTIIRDLRNNAVQGAFSDVVVEGAPEGVSFAVDTSQPGAVVLRAAAAVAVSAPVATTPEGEPAPFVLTHPAAAEPFTINFALGGTATRFADYTVSATGGSVRAQPNTTQTVVTLYPRRDADPNEGPEAVTLEVLLSGGATPEPGAGEAGIAIADGPSINALTLDGVAPAEGENLGTVTATVFGTGFGESATVSLEGPLTIQGETAEGTASGVRASFDLAGAPTGTYDVVVQSGGETATLENAFTVLDGTPDVPVWASVSGTPSPRFGRWSTYTITVGNDGLADLYDTLLFLYLNDGLEYELLDADILPGTEFEDDLTGVSVEGATVIPLYLLKLDAGGTRQVRVRVRPTSPIGIGDEIVVGVRLFPPNPEALFTYSGDPADLGLDVEAGRRTNWTMVWIASQTVEGALRTAAGRLGGLTCGGGFQGGNNLPPDLVYDPAPDINMLLNTLTDFASNPIVLGFVIRAAGAALGVSNPVGWTVLVIGTVIQLSEPASGDPQGGGVGGGQACGTVGGSFDPNDKLGPGGWAEERFYRPTVGTPYTVRFENLDTATFPAQEVVIVDTLDTEAFDLSTFAFGPIRWGVDGEVVPPPGAQAFETEVSLAPEFDATLLITAALETETGRATWHFVTLDNGTGDLPEDGTVGFLPPNQTQPEGEGSVGFVVDARPGLSTGAVVANQAEIVFDVNEPIVTPAWVNTVDLDAPVSSVQPIEPSPDGPVTVEVEGSDLGAGIQTYALYVAEADGPFELYAISNEPTFEFEGEDGVLYGFYSITADYVQNREGPKDEAEATVVYGSVASEEDASLPREVTLVPPYPNPSRDETTLRWGLPEAGRVTVQVYDLLGREVARLADGQATQPGWHETRWQTTVASGVYIVRLQAESGRQAISKTQRLVIVR